MIIIITIVFNANLTLSHHILSFSLFFYLHRIPPSLWSPWPKSVHVAFFQGMTRINSD